MSVHRYAAKRDAVEKGIVWVLRYAGCVVYPLSSEGVPDLLVSCPWHTALNNGGDGMNVNYLIECKDPDTGRMKPAQITFNKEWMGQNAVATTPTEALAIVNAPSMIAESALWAYMHEMTKPESKRFKSL